MTKVLISSTNQLWPLITDIQEISVSSTVCCSTLKSYTRWVKFHPQHWDLATRKRCEVGWIGVKFWNSNLERCKIENNYGDTQKKTEFVKIVFTVYWIYWDNFKWIAHQENFFFFLYKKEYWDVQTDVSSFAFHHQHIFLLWVPFSLIFSYFSSFRLFEISVFQYLLHLRI